MKRWIKIFFIELVLVTGIFSLIVYRKYSVNNRPIETTMKGDFVDTESKISSEIESQMLIGKRNIDLDLSTIFKKPKDIFNIIDQISNKNPEIMYYQGAEYRLGRLTIFYTKSSLDLIDHQEKIQVKRDEFLKTYIHPNLSDYQKVLLAHNYIVLNSRFDMSEKEGKVLPPEAYTAYGILVLGKGVCEGYANALKYLLDGMGLESMIVIGHSKGENHAWNLVKLGGDYYHVDATWDDPVTEDELSILRYNYFNLNDEDLSKTHTWTREDYPKAEGIKYNYFVYNNLIPDDLNDFVSILKESLIGKKGNLSLKTSKVGSFDFASIIEGLVRKNYQLIRLTGYSYSIDEDQEIINIEFYY